MREQSRIIYLAMALLAAAPSNLAQPALATTPSEDKQIAALRQRLSALPPEFEADGLLVLLEAGKISKSEVNAVVDTVFLSAGRASLSAPQRGTYSKYLRLIESVPAAIASASRNGFTQLELRLRAVQLLSRYNLPHAVELFDQIDLPRPVLACTDPLIPLPGIYYEQALRLYQLLEKLPRPKAREDAQDWLRRHLTVRHESQIGPVARTIKTLDNDPALFPILAGQFALDLSQLNPTFTGYAATMNDIGEPLVRLVQAAELQGIASTAIWRGFLDYNRAALGATRCNAIPAAMLSQQLQELVEKVRHTKLIPEIAEGLQFLTKLTPKATDDAAPPDPLFDSDTRFEDLTTQVRILRFGPADKEHLLPKERRADGMAPFLPLQERRTLAWQQQAERYLRQIEEFAKQPSGDPTITLLKTAQLYLALINILPVDSDLMPVACSFYLSYLSGSPVLRERPLVWILFFRFVVSRTSDDEPERGREFIQRLIRDTGSQLMNTLLEVDRLRPPL